MYNQNVKNEIYRMSLYFKHVTNVYTVLTTKGSLELPTNALSATVDDNKFEACTRVRAVQDFQPMILLSLLTSVRALFVPWFNK